MSLLKCSIVLIMIHNHLGGANIQKKLGKRKKNYKHKFVSPLIALKLEFPAAIYILNVILS